MAEADVWSWAAGYVCAVDWATSLILDVAVIQELMMAGRCARRTTVVKRFHDAFRAFSPDWVVGVDTRDRPVNLGQAIRVVARDRTPGGRSKDLSRDLRDRLGWDGLN
jgi:hypothetical protein